MYVSAEHILEWACSPLNSYDSEVTFSYDLLSKQSALCPNLTCLRPPVKDLAGTANMKGYRVRFGLYYRIYL